MAVGALPVSLHVSRNQVRKLGGPPMAVAGRDDEVKCAGMDLYVHSQSLAALTA
jgi:hypothetical protein